MSRPRAADDFDFINSRMGELGIISNTTTYNNDSDFNDDYSWLKLYTRFSCYVPKTFINQYGDPVPAGSYNWRCSTESHIELVLTWIKEGKITNIVPNNTYRSF